MAHVDVPGEVGPDTGCRTGIYALEAGEQIRAQPAELAASVIVPSERQRCASIR